MRYNKVSTHLKSRGLLPSRYACHLPPGGRLFLKPIITQIGRENNISAEIFVLVISPLRMRREAPALRCTDIFLCIYCEFRICLTNASCYAYTPILNSLIRTSAICFLSFLLTFREVKKSLPWCINLLRKLGGGIFIGK